MTNYEEYSEVLKIQLDLSEHKRVATYNRQNLSDKELNIIRGQFKNYGINYFALLPNSIVCTINFENKNTDELRKIADYIDYLYNQYYEITYGD